MKLDHLNKNEKRQVPEGYFEAFPDKILERVSKEESKTTVLKINYYWSIAASISLLIAASFFSNIFDVSENNKAHKSALQIENMNYYDYIDLYISDFEAIELYEEEKQIETEINEYLMDESDVDQIIELL